jgi:N-carbamoylputrescine amidase
MMARMRVTVCQLPDDRDAFDERWRALCVHARAEQPKLIVLPEMPFALWFAARRPFDEAVWRAAEEAHGHWARRLKEIGESIVVYSRPATVNGVRRNEGVAASGDGAETIAHVKRYLPDEPGFWEANWYECGDGAFAVASAGGAEIGFQICTDLWFFEEARKLGLAGAEIIACPRATPEASTERWLVAGQAAAITAGAFCLSSNRDGPGREGVVFGGAGWIIDPDGELIARTSEAAPFATHDINLGKAREAKRTYPRYVR